MDIKIDNNDGLICSRCNVPLVTGKVHVTYLISTFPAELLKCPECGLVYVSEELATGRMAEVEKNLEDK